MPDWLATKAQRYRAILITGMVLLIILVLSGAFAALIPFFLGFILAYLLVPVVDFLDDHAPPLVKRLNLSRKLAILFVYLVIFGLIAGALAYFVPVLTAQAQEFGAVIPDYIDQIDRLLLVDIGELLERIPEPIREGVEDALQDAVTLLGDTIRRGIEGTLLALWQTVSFILGVLLIPIWLIYVLNDSDRFRRSFYRMIPAGYYPDVRNIITILDDLLGAYLRGQLLLCLLVGVMAAVLLLVLNVNLALLLATVAGIFEIIPLLGPWIGAIPAVLIAFLRSPITALWVALGFLAIQQIESYVLSPRIRGEAVRFHPAVVMILVVLGSEIAGLWGIVLAAPVAAMIRDVYVYLYLRTTERGATPEMAMEALRARSL